MNLEKYTTPETYAKIVDFASIGVMWKNSVALYAENVAIEDINKYTFADLDKDASHVRAALRKAGVGKGQVVAILIQNSYDFVKAFLGIATYGAVAALLPAHLPNDAVFGCSYKFGAKAIITSNELKEKTEAAKEKLGIKVFVANKINDGEEPMAELQKNDPCAILFTGGTTGKSKGALLSHGALMKGAKNGCYGYHDVFEEKLLLVLPLTHVFGLVRNLLTSLYTGSTLFITRNNKDMFRDIAAFKPTILVMVPALAEMALGLSKQFGKNMLGDSVKYIICGAAVVPPYLVREYDKLGITLFPGYGLTESANLVSGNPESKAKPSSVGLVYEGMETKVVNGELWLKGDNMMLGYVDEEDNKQAYEDGWFKTGDLVRFDEEGFLYITGRTKEIIVLPTGENVSPAELENRFNTIDAIQDSLVYEKKGALAIQVLPRASVISALGITDVPAYISEEIQKVNATLPAFERISEIVIRDKDFARSPSMKILRDKNVEE